VRIATFNVLHGRSLTDGAVDLDRFAKAVAGLEADVLGLQEVDRDQPRSHGADLAGVAAAAMGATHVRFVAALSGTPGDTWTAADGAEQPGSPAYGIALISRHPVLSWQVVRLPAPPVRVPLPVPGSRFPVLVRDEPRVAVAALVESPFGPVTVCTTHLSFVPGWNRRQLRTVMQELGGADGPLVLTGDLNMRRRPAARVSGLRSIAEGATFPAHHPRRQLDHVLVRGPVRVTDPAEVVELPLSDHRAVVVGCRPA
jgi:endonuclease/exonuclease/phosphatase family metal-dependent hydrolase